MAQVLDLNIFLCGIYSKISLEMLSKMILATKSSIFERVVSKEINSHLHRLRSSAQDYPPRIRKVNPPQKLFLKKAMQSTCLFFEPAMEQWESQYCTKICKVDKDILHSLSQISVQRAGVVGSSAAWLQSTCNIEKRITGKQNWLKCDLKTKFHIIKTYYLLILFLIPFL